MFPIPSVSNFSDAAAQFLPQAFASQFSERNATSPALQEINDAARLGEIANTLTGTGAGVQSATSLPNVDYSTSVKKQLESYDGNIRYQTNDERIKEIALQIWTKQQGNSDNIGIVSSLESKPYIKGE